MIRGKRVLVTGAAGFVGRVMTQALRHQGAKADAYGRIASPDAGGFDVTDADACSSVLREREPEVIVHLAGRTYLPDVLAHPRESFTANVLGTDTLLRAALQWAPKCRFLLVSTCSVFGCPSPESLPLSETAPPRPDHPYGVQKIGMELLGERARERGLDVIVVRPFNHVGPGMHSQLSVAHFVKQIVAAERGEGPSVLRVGNLSARRDFTDVRDVVAAYLSVIEHPSPPPLLHVASGRSLSLGEVLLDLVARSRVGLTVETDPTRLRPSDVPDLVGDASLLRRTTGWSPRHALSDTWDRMLSAARGEDYGGDW